MAQQFRWVKYYFICPGIHGHGLDLRAPLRSAGAQRGRGRPSRLGAAGAAAPGPGGVRGVAGHGAAAAAGGDAVGLDVVLFL